MKGRAVYYENRGEKKVALLEWPSPDHMSYTEPVEAARSYYRMWESYMAAYFPNFDEQQLFVLFDLDAELTMPDRVALLRSFAERVGVCPEACLPIRISYMCRLAVDMLMVLICIRVHRA